ncbi:MAG: DEAD/DEAH box helicase [Dehalococcoidia bacterium]|nr:DEAD/DEAH box helicase [Dehalococcoidia bacterium]
MNESAFIHKLSSRVWNHQQFQKELSNLNFSNVYYSILGTTPHNMPSEEEALRLIKTAAILADSEAPDHRRAAYRIAIACLNLFPLNFPNLENILHIILGKLGNFPAIDFMFNNLKTSKQYNLPSMALYELIGHELDNTITLGQDEIVLTDFQRRLWHEFSDHKNVSVSAITSAGKSFALQRFLINEMLAGTTRFILYIVPTRALIGQVSEVFSNWFGRLGKGYQISTIPQTPKELAMDCGIYVLTQERTHVLLTDVPEMAFDIVVVDEAQTIAAGARGVLLQIVLEKLASAKRDTKFLFGAALTNNPAFYSCIIDEEITSVKETSDSPVAQNIISIEINPNRSKYAVMQLYHDTLWIDLAEVELTEPLYDEKATLAYLSYYWSEPLRLDRTG